MTTYESNMSKSQRADYYKTEILWYMNNPSPLSERLIEIDTAKLKSEIGEAEVEKYLASLKSNALEGVTK